MRAALPEKGVTRLGRSAGSTCAPETCQIPAAKRCANNDIAI